MKQYELQLTEWKTKPSKEMIERKWKNKKNKYPSKGE